MDEAAPEPGVRDPRATLLADVDGGEDGATPQAATLPPSAVADIRAEHEEEAESADTDDDTDDEEGDEEEKVDESEQVNVGTKMNANRNGGAKMSVRNLRIREDTAK